MTFASRRAFSLVELLIVIVVFGIVLGALMKVIIGQQRFYRGTSEMVETQDNVRDAVDLLQGELRGISPAQGDIATAALSATSIKFWKPIGAAVVCVIAADRKSFTVPPLQLTTNAGLTSWSSVPKQDDRVLVYDPWTSDAMGDDRWDQLTLEAAPTPNAACPATTGLTTADDVANTGYTFALSSALGANVPAQGSAVRVLRQVKYSLYQAEDGRWYLGYQECPGNVCDAIQPVSGPYLPPSTSGQSGLTLTYYDNAGTVTATPTAVARIDVTVRAATQSVMQIAGLAAAPHVDSLTASISVRN